MNRTVYACLFGAGPMHAYIYTCIYIYIYTRVDDSVDYHESCSCELLMVSIGVASHSGLLPFIVFCLIIVLLSLRPALHSSKRAFASSSTKVNLMRQSRNMQESSQH